MAAPAPTVRQSPAGIKLDNGHQTLVTFSLDPDLEFWEKTITPPGVDGGDAVDTTTMHNTIWRTKAPRTLKDLTDMSIVGAYDPVMYTRAVTLVNRKQTITVTFPDGSTLAFYGFIKTQATGELAEGTQPTMTFTVVATNQDPITGDEEAPVLHNISGT